MRVCKRFPAEVRQAAVGRVVEGGQSYASVARQVGASDQSVRKWVLTAQGVEVSKKRGKGKRSTDQRSAEEKLKLLLGAAALSDTERGEFLRREGIRDGDLERWHSEALEGLKGQARNAADRQRIAELERAEGKQQRRLRELEALVELQKKVQALWAAKDDDTSEPCG